MSFKDINAANTTQTYDRTKIEKQTGNIYESIAIIGKRAEQVNQKMKGELIQKLDEFAAHTDSLEEIFENREQIEVSRYYERLPKPTSVAVKEWLDGEVYYRNPNEEN